MTDADADGKMQKKKIADNSIIIIFWIYQFTKACLFLFMALLYLNPDYK